MSKSRGKNDLNYHFSLVNYWECLFQEVEKLEMVLPTTCTLMGMTRALRALVMTITVLVAGKTHFRFFNFLEKIHFLQKVSGLPNVTLSTKTTTMLGEKTTTTCVRRRKKVKPCVLLPAFYVFSAFSLSGYFSCRSLWSKVKTCRLYELFLNFLPTFSPFQRRFSVLYENFICPLKKIT